MLRRARPEFQDREQMGAEPPARACRRARPESRGPRASRGEKAHTRARDGERLPEKRPRPSSPKARRGRALPADAGGKGRIPGEADGPRARREPVGLLLMALQRPPARRLVGRARGGPARVAGAGPQVRLPVREALPARRVLRPHPVQGAQIDARAGDTRMHAQRVEAHCDPGSQGEAPARPGAARLHRPRARLQARGRHRVPAHRRGVAAPLDGHRPGHPHGGGLVALRANDGGHRGIGAGVGQIARLRGGKRDIPRRPRRPVHQQAFGRVGARQRRAPVLQPLRQLPRQRGGGIEAPMYVNSLFSPEISARHRILPGTERSSGGRSQRSLPFGIRR